MRPPPTTFEAIEVVALREPDRLALAEDARRWTYGDFYADLVRVTHVLARLGVRRGQRVAVSRPSLQVQLLLLIACENLGAVTASFQAQGDPDAPALFALVEWVFSEQRQMCPVGVQFCRIDEAFARLVAGFDAQDGEPCPRVALELHEPQRLVRTSGSTGPPRFMLLTRAAQEYWISSGAQAAGYTPESRLLLAGPLVINVAFTRSSACLRLGAAVLDAAALAGEASHVWALPTQLEQLLGRLPARFAMRRPADIGTGGGTLSPQLRAQAVAAFGGQVTNRYGTNEVGLICDDLDAAGEGLLSVGVDVRIVDAQGDDVPAGEIGCVVVQTPAMTDGYLKDPLATQAAFRDGWFHTGDVGALLGQRRLRLAGRHDDLLNIGGIKVPAAQVGAQVRQLPRVRDCAVLAVNLHGGIVTVGIALVADTHTDEQALMRRIEETLVLGASTAVRIIFVESVPRLSNGKVDRMALHLLLSQ